MGYSSDDAMVRVDFFKPSGKWYTTEAVRWAQYKRYDDDGNVVLIHDAFQSALADHLQLHEIRNNRCEHCGKSGVSAANHCPMGRFRLAGMTAVCLEPHCEDAHPIMDVVPGGYASVEEMGPYADAWLRDRITRSTP